MIELYDYTGSQVIIYDEDKHATIARTSIQDHHKATHTITLKSSAFQDSELPEHISLLILHDSAVYEYKGTVRKLGKGSERVEVALYKGQEKESRAATRYEVNSAAMVESLVMVGRLVPLAAPLQVTVCNISTQGCLLRGGVSFFNVGATFQLKLLTDQAPILMYATVVRIKNVRGETAEFGCSFTAI